MAIWMKALWVLCESMNFHPDKQLFQVAGTIDRTTDLWITRPELYPYTTGDSLLLDLKKRYEYSLTNVLNPLLGTEEKVSIHHKPKCTSLSRQSKQVWTCLRPNPGFSILFQNYCKVLLLLYEVKLGNHVKYFLCLLFLLVSVSGQTF